MRFRSLLCFPPGIETDVLTVPFQRTADVRQRKDDERHLSLASGPCLGPLWQHRRLLLLQLCVPTPGVVDMRSLFPCSTMYQFVNVTHGLYLDPLAAVLQEHSPLIISASLLSSTNLVLPFPVSLIDKFRAAGFPSTSKSSICLQTLGVHDERSESVIH